MPTSLTLRSVKGSGLTNNEIDTNFTNLRATADAAAAAAIVRHPGYVSGFSYLAGQIAVNSGAAVSAVDTLYLYPFIVEGNPAINALFARCTAIGAGSSFKIGLWANNPATGRPTSTPVLASNTDLATSATGGIKSATVSGTLTPGVYWIGTKYTGTLPSMALVTNGSQIGWLIGNSSNGAALSSNGSQIVGLSAPDAYTNDITLTNLTGATFTAIATTTIPACGFTVA